MRAGLWLLLVLVKARVTEAAGAIFSDDPALYAETIAIGGIVAATPFVLSRIKTGAFRGIDQCVRLTIFISAMSAVGTMVAIAWQGADYIGNVLTTSTITLVMLVRFLDVIATFAAPSDLAERMQLGSYAALAFFAPLVANLIDIITDGGATIWLQNHPTIAVFVLFTGPLTLLAAWLTRRPPTPAWKRRSVGGFLVLTLGSWVVFATTGFQEHLPWLVEHVDALTALAALALKRVARARLSNTSIAAGVSKNAPFLAGAAFGVSVLRLDLPLDSDDAIRIALLVFFILATRAAARDTETGRQLHAYALAVAFARAAYLLTSVFGISGTIGPPLVLLCALVGAGLAARETTSDNDDDLV